MDDDDVTDSEASPAIHVNTSITDTEENSDNPLKNVKGKLSKLGRYLAIDCEMVGVGPGGTESALARVTVVNIHGYPVYDKYVRPKEKVTDFRTSISGIEPRHIAGEEAVSLEEAQRETADLFKNRVVVGHAIQNDLKALFLSHPSSKIRDTSKYRPFRKISGGRTPSLRKLAAHFLGRTIQGGTHDSVEDAKATMDLYLKVKNDWEGKVAKRQKIRSTGKQGNRLKFF